MKLAIIGASTGQQKLCIKAHEMGITTIGIAWSKGAICKDLFDKFYDVSIMDFEKVIEICKQEQVDGVVTNGSNLTIESSSYVAEALNLPCTPYATIKAIKDKHFVRQKTQNIDGLQQVKNYEYDGQEPLFFPCIVKPVSGAAKEGVSFVANKDEFAKAIRYAQGDNGEKKKILIEEFIEGREVSVESISSHGNHFVIQVTDKDSTGAPHFVEIGHHQPANISNDLRNRIDSVVPKILQAVEFQNGATHIELKINNKNEIYLIEINPRGGGDEISNTLVGLSTNVDYVKTMIEVALGTFTKPDVHNIAYSGIYFLCKQTAQWENFFKLDETQPWLFFKHINSTELIESTGNRNRNGYIIYKSDKKIEPII